MLSFALFKMGDNSGKSAGRDQKRNNICGTHSLTFARRPNLPVGAQTKENDSFRLPKTSN